MLKRLAELKVRDVIEFLILCWVYVFLGILIVTSVLLVTE